MNPRNLHIMKLVQLAALQCSTQLKRRFIVGVTIGANEKVNDWWREAAALAAITTALCQGIAQNEEERQSSEMKENEVRKEINSDIKNEAVERPGEYRSDLPVLKLEEIEKRKNKETGIWMIYQRGVYDVTEFIAQHPGGSKILLAAGGSIEPYWNVFKAHHDDTVYEMLEHLRIGNLSIEDATSLAKAKKMHQGQGPYEHEPERHPLLKVNSQQPFNAEPPPELLSATFETPSELFFVRNHLPVPVIEQNEEEYQIEIWSCVQSIEEKYQISLATLKNKYPQHTLTATLQCAGNRRSEMSETKSVKGLSWSKAAIGTATWTGARLIDVLTDILGQDKIKALNDSEFHVRFRGLDVGPDNEHYETSVPASIALDIHRDSLLAYEMNKKPLSRDHGFPIRAIIPGVVGARNVKFLDRITLATTESQSFWQQKDYRVLPPNVDYQTPDFFRHAGPAIQELPVTSAILEPAPASFVNAQEDLLIKGYAWSGGGRKIVRVDVSLDAGLSWQPAELIRGDEQQPDHRAWAWTLWELCVDHNTLQSTEKLDIRCKAIDAAYNSQPEDIRPIWNPRGLLNNAWGRVQVSPSKS